MMDVKHLICTQEAVKDAATSIADRLDLDVIHNAVDCNRNYALLLDTSGLSLVQPSDKKMVKLYVDFCEGALAWRRRHGGGNGQAIAKAVGLKSRKELNVLDATAGTGSDSFVLACLGCEVSMIERHPIVAALLSDALDRARLHSETQPIANQMSLICDSSLEWMRSHCPDKKYDVVYLDPMFPHSGKSAQVKKSMQFFRDIVGKDEDADDLLEPALDLATYRVVVKRPKKSPFLANKPPTLSHEGKANRFDIYVNQSMK